MTAICDSPSGVCTPCETNLGSSTLCPINTFCATGATSQSAYVTGTCYVSECSKDDHCAQNLKCEKTLGICLESTVPISENISESISCSTTEYCYEEIGPTYYCDLTTSTCFEE
jgi:hypothetical protein